MSLESGEYRITNKKVPLVLSLSDNDQRSVIAEDRGSPDNQTVRIASPFDSFLQTHSHCYLVDHTESR
jgi:hypothetical protein